MALLQNQYNFMYIHNLADRKHDDFCGDAKFLYKTTIVVCKHILLMERTWIKIFLC